MSLFILGRAAVLASLLAATASAQSQLRLAPIELLPNAPATYQMRDWQTVATNFDALAFNVGATGQFLPLVKIDNTPQNPQLQTAFGLAAYVGETRAFGETGEPVHEAISSLGAVLGGTLAGIDKTAGQYNWVSMTREYYAGSRGHRLILNNPFARSGQSAWYDIYPNILFYTIADRYPGQTYLAPMMDSIDDEFYDAVDALTAGGANPNFNYTAYNFATDQPVYNGQWQEPDMGLGMAWMQHAAYWRQKDSNPVLAAQHLSAVDWALRYYEQTSANPDYEILPPFGAYAAARMNAEHDGNYDVQKLVKWVFERSAARPTKIMISGEQWGGQDAGGLMGFTIPNIGDVRGYAFSMNTFATALPMVPLTRYEDRYSRAIGKWMLHAASAARPTKIMISGEQWGGQDAGGLMGFTIPNIGDVRGYAFSMNTFATALPMVPLTRYEDRYSRAIGKWMLHAASAARLFYKNAHTPQNQSSEFWTGDPTSAIAYEGLRHHWHRADDSEELYAAGDPLTYGWGPQTDFALYGGAYAGVFGSIVKTTNVEKILQLDLLATDSFRDVAHDTFLYYNPHGSAKSVAIELGDAQLFDLYDAASNRFLARGVTGQTFFNVAADDAVQLVVIPAGGRQSFDGRRMLVDDVVVDYNAALLPGNLVRNANVDVAATSNPTRPGFWHYSQNAQWSKEQAVSPTHSLKLADADALRSEEWRSYATAVPADTERTLQLRWYWDYDATDEFRARLRLSPNAVSGLDLTNTTLTYDFTISGSSNGFELFEMALAIPDNIQSFDLTFITGGLASAMGTLFIDDVSASILPRSAFKMMESDFNGDGAVDGLDLEVWKQGFGMNFDGADFLAWQRNLTSGNGGSLGLARTSDSAIPEPGAALLAWAAFAASLQVRAVLVSRSRRRAPPSCRGEASFSPSVDVSSS